MFILLTALMFVSAGAAEWWNCGQATLVEPHGSPSSLEVESATNDLQGNAILIFIVYDF